MSGSLIPRKQNTRSLFIDGENKISMATRIRLIELQKYDKLILSMGARH